MNFDAIISWLLQADWLFVLIWLALLVFAVALAFPAPPTAARNLPRRSQSPSHGD
jgi:hypothetical protein